MKPHQDLFSIVHSTQCCGIQIASQVTFCSKLDGFRALSWPVVPWLDDDAEWGPVAEATVNDPDMVRLSLLTTFDRALRELPRGHRLDQLRSTARRP